MRIPPQPGLPVMPDADDVLEAIRRLELTGPHEKDDLGPSVEAGVSGRSVSAGGPLVSPSLRELGLLLDDELIDNLLMTDVSRVSIPVEMAREALADPGPGPGGADAAGAIAPRTAGTPGARRRTTSWSGREPERDRRELTATLVPSTPAFLTDWPVRRRAPRAVSGFAWDLLGADRAPTRLEPLDEAKASLTAGRAASAETSLAVTAALQPSPAAGGRWTSSGGGERSERPRASGASSRRGAYATLSGEPSREPRRHDAERALAMARRGPSAATVALASLVFPGWGQRLNEEPSKAAVFRGVYLATLFLAATLAWRGPLARLAAGWTGAGAGPLFAWLGSAFSVGAGLWLLSIYDALVVRLAHRH